MTRLPVVEIANPELASDRPIRSTELHEPDDAESAASYDTEFEDSLRCFQLRLEHIEERNLPQIRLVPNVSEEWLQGGKRAAGTFQKAVIDRVTPVQVFILP